MASTIVARNDLRMFLDGVLLEFKAGKAHVVNETACDAALAAMERGERVLLTSGNTLTGTYVVLDGGKYYERQEDGATWTLAGHVVLLE